MGKVSEGAQDCCGKNAGGADDEPEPKSDASVTDAKRPMAVNPRAHAVVETTAPDADEILAEIIREAPAALREEDLKEHVDRIHRKAHVLAQRIRRLEDERDWSKIEKASAKAEAEA